MTTERALVTRRTGSSSADEGSDGLDGPRVVVGSCGRIAGRGRPRGVRRRHRRADRPSEVFGFGSFVVNTVAALMPTAALLVALLTYTLQVVAMGLVFVALSGSGAARRHARPGMARRDRHRGPPWSGSCARSC